MLRPMSSVLQDSAVIPRRAVVSVVALVDAAIVALLSLAGGIQGFAAIAGMILLGILVFSQIGLVTCAALMSHISLIPGLDFDVLRFGKWIILFILMWVTVIRLAGTKEKLGIRFGTFEKSILAFIAWGLVCTMFAVRPLDSFVALLRIATLPVLYLAARCTITTTSHVRIIIGAIVFALVANSVYSIGVFLSGQAIRVAGFYPNANSLGIFMMFSLPLVFVALLAYRSRPLRLLLALCLIVGSVVLLLTWSRASILAICGSTIVFLVLENRKILIALTGVMVVAAVMVFLSSDVFESFSDLTRLKSSTTHRVVLWEHGMNAIEKNPILGQGFVVHTEDIREKAVWTGVSEAMTVGLGSARYTAHNFYLHTVVSTGIPGLILMAIVYVNLFRLLTGTRRKARMTSHRLLFSAVIAILAGSLLNSVFENGPIFGSGSTANYFWITLGMAAAMSDKNIDF